MIQIGLSQPNKPIAQMLNTQYSDKIDVKAHYTHAKILVKTDNIIDLTKYTIMITDRKETRAYFINPGHCHITYQMGKTNYTVCDLTTLLSPGNTITIQKKN